MNFSGSFIYIYFEVEPSAQDLFSNPAEYLPPAALVDEGALLIVSALVDARVLYELQVWVVPPEPP